MKRTLSLTLATLALAGSSVALAGSASAGPVETVNDGLAHIVEGTEVLTRGCIGVQVFYLTIGYGNGCP